MKTPNTQTVLPHTEPKKVFATIIRHINDIFSNKQVYSSNNFQKLLAKIMGGKKITIAADMKSQDTCFQTICYITNNLCNNTKIKKFYNTAPLTSLTDYITQELDQQLLNNIYHSNRQRFYEQDIGGGNCHYRTALFKKIFDIFEQQGLQLTSKIIAYKNTGGHSFLFVSFQGKDYIMDVGGFDETSKNSVTPVQQLDKATQARIYDIIKTHKKKDSPIMIYDNTMQFAKYIDAKPIKNISIQFKPKLQKEDTSNNIDIAINKKFISIDTDNKKYTFPINSKYHPENHINTSRQFFNDIINYTSASSEAKNIYNKYIYMIADKINYHKIKSLWEQS